MTEGAPDPCPLHGYAVPPEPACAPCARSWRARAADRQQLPVVTQVRRVTLDEWLAVGETEASYPWRQEQR